MKNKVEITGVNTAELKVIDQNLVMDLIKLAHEGDIEARDEVVLGNLKLVLSVIKKFNNRGENLDDLFQVGCMGLIKAIDNFDFIHGVKFSTYAVPMIIGEIRRYLRDNSKIRVSRSLKDIAYKALQFKERYYSENGKEPSTEEIAKYLEVEPLDVIIAIEAVQEPVSIYTPIFNNGGAYIDMSEHFTDSFYNYFMLFLGQAMVALFFFYSGYGIIESHRDKPEYTKHFFKNRFLKTLVHFDMAIILFIIVNACIGKEYELGRTLTAFTGWTSVGNSNWFIFTTLVLYLLTLPMLRIFQKRQWAVVLAVTLLTIGFIIFLKSEKDSWWYNTLLCYPLGMLWSVARGRIEDAFRHKIWLWWISVAISAAALVFLIY